MTKTSRLHMLVVALFLCFIVILIGVFVFLLTFLLQNANGLLTLTSQ